MQIGEPHLIGSRPHLLTFVRLIYSDHNTFMKATERQGCSCTWLLCCILHVYYTKLNTFQQHSELYCCQCQCALCALFYLDSLIFLLLKLVNPYLADKMRSSESYAHKTKNNVIVWPLSKQTKHWQSAKMWKIIFWLPSHILSSVSNRRSSSILI